MHMANKYTHAAILSTIKGLRDVEWMLSKILANLDFIYFKPFTDIIFDSSIQVTILIRVLFLSSCGNHNADKSF